MTTYAEVESQIAALTLAQLSGHPVVFGNTSDAELSAGEVDYVTQRVAFTSQNQLGLGDSGPSRNNGVVAFVLHTRKNTGSAGTLRLLDLILSAFRSKRVGVVTFKNAQMGFTNSSGNWNMTGVTIPFYFDLN